jgi:uncharacterized membrane protein
VYKVEASIEINAPVGEVYEKTASPHNGPVFLPNLNENSNISSERTAVGQSWSWRYNFLGADLTGTAEVVDITPNRSWALTTQGDVTSTWTYRFEEAGSGTRVTLSVEYDMPAGRLQNVTEAVAQRMNQDACEQAMQNLKAWIEP